MNNFLSPVNEVNLDKYKNWELRLKTKEQVERLIDINNNKRWRSWIKTEDLILRLNNEEFFDFLNNELTKNVFTNKKVEYYESLLKRLDELKNFNNKNTIKDYRKKIENWLEKYCKNNDINYLKDYVIKNNPKYQNTFDLIKSGNYSVNFCSKYKDYTCCYLTLKNTKTNTGSLGKESFNNPNLLDLLYKNQETNIVLFKIQKEKLINLLIWDIGFENYIKGKIRWKWALEKINDVYDNSDYEMLELLIIKNLIHHNNNLDKLEKILELLNRENWKKDVNCNKKLLTGLKLEINRIKSIKLEIDWFEAIKGLFNTSPNEAKSILIEWRKTKKGEIIFEKFIKYITENRWRGWAKKYNNKKILEEIIKQISENTDSSKNTDKLLNTLNKELDKINELIKNKKTIEN